MHTYIFCEHINQYNLYIDDGCLAKIRLQNYIFNHIQIYIHIWMYLYTGTYIFVEPKWDCRSRSKECKILQFLILDPSSWKYVHNRKLLCWKYAISGWFKLLICFKWGAVHVKHMVRLKSELVKVVSWDLLWTICLSSPYNEWGDRFDFFLFLTPRYDILRRCNDTSKKATVTEQSIRYTTLPSSI